MNTKEKSWSAAWNQFLVGKRQMLAEYRQALVHSRELPVKVHHGVAGEASVRSWLETFLPKRYGITSGYIRGQRLRTAADYAHFDVIVYDQIDSPVLWQESNPDMSPLGRKRIIPAEHVRAVVEVKAALTLRTARQAADKLAALRPLMAGVDAANEPYPTYLAANTVLVMLFFELREDSRNELSLLEALEGAWALPRVAYGPVLLSGEGRPDEDTGLIRQTVSDLPHEPIELDAGLLSHVYMSATTPKDGRNLGAMLTWSPMHFSDFAFDLLALMNGTYRQGRVSSFHGIDLGQYPGTTADPRGSLRNGIDPIDGVLPQTQAVHRGECTVSAS